MDLVAVKSQRNGFDLEYPFAAGKPSWMHHRLG